MAISERSSKLKTKKSFWLFLDLDLDHDHDGPGVQGLLHLLRQHPRKTGSARSRANKTGLLR